ncbi:MAG: rhodanese-like domain-containing protein [Bacteroidota bacterium]
MITVVQIAPPSLAQKVTQPTDRTLLRTLLNEHVPHITVSQLAHMEPKPLLLDSREREEFEVSHIPGAL